MFAQGNHGDNVHEACMERVGGGAMEGGKNMNLTVTITMII